MNTEKTGEFIAELRKEKQLTQSQLATAIHVSDQGRAAVHHFSRTIAYKGIPRKKKVHKHIVGLRAGINYHTHRVHTYDESYIRQGSGRSFDNREIVGREHSRCTGRKG